MTEHKVTWDGKNLNVIQMIPFPRHHGIPYATVDEQWHLQLDGLDVPAGSEIGYEVNAKGTAVRWWLVP